MRYLISCLLVVVALCQGATAGCTTLPTYHSRKVLQASADANAAAIDNLSGQTTNQTASAAASAEAVATSVVPLPRKFLCMHSTNLDRGLERCMGA
jgi:hypothetical protein